MIQNKVPPHITIGAFHGAKDDEGRRKRILHAGNVVSPHYPCHTVESVAV